ncbi:MAG: rod shape-determining protein [Deltaproteobacteria bacterium]|nr:rod shape-determining protein [Deltaproteobacteria bacterium]
MFSAVLGLFSQDLAVDLGSTHTRVLARGPAAATVEPTVIAVRTDRRGRRAVIATGAEALPMLGRAPDDTLALQPIRGGRIVDYEAAEAFLLSLVRRIHGRNAWIRPRMVVAVPHGASDMELRAVRDSCESAGAREVHLVPRPVAAAMGADLPIQQASGYLVVDVGGGSTEVSVLSLSGVVASRSVPGGGEGMDDAIVRWVEQHHGLLIGRPTAERVKIALGNAFRAELADSVVKGRCLALGVPRAVTLQGEEIHRALLPAVAAIGEAIQRTIEGVPPEIGSDIVDHGIVLTGAGARLAGLDLAMREATGLPVIVAENPELAVVAGARRLLDQLDVRRERVA